jgi:hypothetical protein
MAYDSGTPMSEGVPGKAFCFYEGGLRPSKRVVERLQRAIAWDLAAHIPREIRGRSSQWIRATASERPCETRESGQCAGNATTKFRISAASFNPGLLCVRAAIDSQTLHRHH